MSSHVFNPGKGPILVRAEATGPLRSMVLKLVLDTGATRSLVKRSGLVYIGIDPDQSTQHTRMTTGSQIEVVPIVVLTRFSALSHHRFGFPIIAHTVPESADVDGVLGLDFLRNHVLTIDFPAGLINLT